MATRVRIKAVCDDNAEEVMVLVDNGSGVIMKDGDIQDFYIERGQQLVIEQLEKPGVYSGTQSEMALEPEYSEEPYSDDQ